MSRAGRGERGASAGGTASPPPRREPRPGAGGRPAAAAGTRPLPSCYGLVTGDAVTTDHQPSLCDDTADAGNAEERERGPSPVSRLTGGVTFRHHGTMTSSKCGMW